MKTYVVIIKDLEGEKILLEYGRDLLISRSILNKTEEEQSELLWFWANKMYSNLEYQMGWKGGIINFTPPDGGPDDRMTIRGVSYLNLKEENK
jgi:hypothetical protein